ncbi:MAG: metalloregulator ArsR/SmtB family transcription factor [Bacteroidota bacterium]
MEHFTSRVPFQELDNSSHKLKAIAHAVRIAILGLLLEHKVLTVYEIQEKLNIEQTATSYHLIQMKNKMVVKSEKKANKMFYSVSDQSFRQILEIILDYPVNSTFPLTNPEASSEQSLTTDP